MKWFAICFVGIGFWGFGVSMIQDKRQYIEQLEWQRQIFYLMQGEMEHFYSPLPEIFYKIAGKLATPYKDFLIEVSRQLQTWNGDSLDHIWTKELACYAEHNKVPIWMLAPIQKIVKELHYDNCQMQLQAIMFATEEIEILLNKKREELEKNQRCILWLCTMAGLLCIIMFL